MGGISEEPKLVNNFYNYLNCTYFIKLLKKIIILKNFNFFTICKLNKQIVKLKINLFYKL
jgi:hypothetical protein